METRNLNDTPLLKTAYQSRQLQKNIGWKFDTASKIKFLKRLKLRGKKNQPMVMLERLEHRLSAYFVKELYKNKSLKVLQDSRPKPKRKKELFQIVDKETYEAKLKAGSSAHNTRRNTKNNLAEIDNSKKMVGDVKNPKFKTLNNKKVSLNASKASHDLVSPKVKIAKEEFYESAPKTSKSQGDNSSSNEPSAPNNKIAKTINVNINKEKQMEVTRETPVIKSKKICSLERISENNSTKVLLHKNKKVCNSNSKRNVATMGPKQSQDINSNKVSSNLKGEESAATGFSNSKNYRQTMPSPPSNPSPDSSSSTVEMNKLSATPDLGNICSTDNNDSFNCDSTMQEVFQNSSNSITSNNCAKFKDLLHKKNTESGEDSGIPKIVLYLRGEGPDKQYRCASNIGKLKETANRKYQSEKFGQQQMNSRYIENRREIELFGDNSNDEKGFSSNNGAGETDFKAEPNDISDNAIFSELEEYKKSKREFNDSLNISENESSHHPHCRSDSLPELENICGEEDYLLQEVTKSKLSDRFSVKEEFKESRMDVGNAPIPWFPKGKISEQSPLRKGTKITLSYKNTGKPTAHVEPYIAESSLRLCSRKGKGFYDENIPFLDCEDLDLSYESLRLPEAKLIEGKNIHGDVAVNPLDSLRESEIKNINNYYNIHSSSFNQSSFNKYCRYQENDNNNDNSFNKTIDSKYDDSLRPSKFTTSRNIIASYCIQEATQKMTQSKKGLLGRTYTYISKTTGEVVTTRRRSLSIDSTLSLFKVRIDNSAIKHSSKSSISMPNLNFPNANRLLQTKSVKNDSCCGKENRMLHSKNHSLKNQKYETTADSYDNNANCSGNTVTESHTSDNQSSGSNSDTSSEISEDSSCEQNNVGFMGLYSTRNTDNAMFETYGHDRSDSAVPFDPQYEVVWGDRTKKHRMKLERRLLKMRAFKRSKNEKCHVNSLKKDDDEEREELGKRIKEIRKRSRDEGNGYENSAVEKQPHKYHEGDRGRRLAQEIPGFNWLEEKIRNTSVTQSVATPSVSSPTVSTSASLTEETEIFIKHPSRSHSCPTGTPKPIPALIPSDEFISSGGDTSPDALKHVTENAKVQRRQSVTSENECSENKTPDSSNVKILAKDEEDSENNNKTLVIRAALKDSLNEYSSSKSSVETPFENIGSMTKQTVETNGGHLKSKLNSSLDNQSSKTLNLPHFKKLMESSCHEEKEASNEESTATSPKRFHIQTAVPPLVPTSKVTALPKRQLMSPPQQSMSSDSFSLLTQDNKNSEAPLYLHNQIDSTIHSPTKFHNESISQNPTKYCNLSSQSKAKPQSSQRLTNPPVQSLHDSHKYFDKDAYNSPSRNSEVLPKFSFQATQSISQDNNPSTASKSVSSHFKSQIPALNSQSSKKSLRPDLKYDKNSSIQLCLSPAASEAKEPIKALAQRNYGNSPPHLKQNTKNNYLIPLNKIKIESRIVPHKDLILNDIMKPEIKDISEKQRTSPKSFMKTNTATEVMSDSKKGMTEENKNENSHVLDCEGSDEMIIDTGDDQDNTCSSESSPQSISVSQKLSILTKAFKSKLNTSLGFSPEQAEDQTETDMHPSNGARQSTTQCKPKSEKNDDTVIKSPPKQDEIKNSETVNEILKCPSSEVLQSSNNFPSKKSEPVSEGKEENPVLISIPETLPSFATVLNGMKMSDSLHHNIFGKETKKETELPNSLIVALYEELMRTRQEVEKLRKVQEQMLNADKYENKNKFSDKPKNYISTESEELPTGDTIKEPTPTPVVIDISNLEDNQETARSEKEEEIARHEQELKLVYEVNNERLKRPLQHVEQAVVNKKRRTSEEEPVINSLQDNTITIRYNIPDDVPPVPKQNQKPTDNIKLRNLLGISNNDLDVVPVEESAPTKNYNDILLQNRELSTHRTSKQEIYHSTSHIRENDRGRDLYPKVMESQTSHKIPARHSIPDLPNLIPSNYPATNIRQCSEPAIDQQRESHLLSLQLTQHNANTRPVLKSSQSHPRSLGCPYEGTRIYNPSDNTYHINGTKLDLISVSEPQPLMAHHSIPIMSQSQGNYVSEAELHQAKYQHTHEGGHKGSVPHFARGIESGQNAISSNDSQLSGLPKFQPKIIIPQNSLDPPNTSAAEWHHPQSTLQENRQPVSSQPQILPPNSRMSAFSNPNYVYGHPNGAHLAHLFPVNNKPSISPPSKQQKLYNTLHQMQQESAQQNQPIITNTNLHSSSSSTHIPASSPLRYTSQGYHSSQHQMQQSSIPVSMPTHSSHGLNQQQQCSNCPTAAQHRQIAVTRASSIQDALQKSYQPVMPNQIIQHRPPHPANLVHSNSHMHPVYASPHTNISHRPPNANRISPHRLSPQQTQQQSRGPVPGMPQASQAHHANQQGRIPVPYQIPPSQSGNAVPQQFKPIQPRIHPPPPYPHAMTANQSLHKVHISENMLVRNQVQQMEQERANNETIEQANLKKATSPTASSKKKCLICPQNAQFLCSGCKTAWYCSKECQREHWGLHSPNCVGRK